jgi:hypothetical protein
MRCRRASSGAHSPRRLRRSVSSGAASDRDGASSRPRACARGQAARVRGRCGPHPRSAARRFSRPRRAPRASPRRGPCPGARQACGSPDDRGARVRGTCRCDRSRSAPARRGSAPRDRGACARRAGAAHASPPPAREPRCGRGAPRRGIAPPGSIWKRTPRMPPCVRRASSASDTALVHDRHAAGAFQAQGRDARERARIVEAVGRGLHDHGAG